MKPWLLVFLFLHFFLTGQSQYSMTLGYSHSAEKVNLGHDAFQWTFKWQKGVFQFSTGLGITQNSFNYNTSMSISHYEYINHGSGIDTWDRYKFSATIFYRYLRIPNSFEWEIFGTEKFKLMSGIFIDLDIRIAEKESDHETLKEWRTMVSSDYVIVEDQTVIEPPSNAPFNAVNMADEQVAFGLIFGPRFIFGQSYLQLELKAGFGYRSRITDAAVNNWYRGASSHKSGQPFEFDKYDGWKRPVVFGVGLCYGYSFKK